MSYEYDLMKIRGACSIHIRNEKGEPVLAVECKLKNKKTGKTDVFNKKYFIKPLIEEITKRLKAYDAHVGLGPFDWSKIEGVSGKVEGVYDLTTDDHVSGWLSNLYHKTVSVGSKAESIAKHIAANKAAQDIYNDILPQVAPFVPGGGIALDALHKAHDLLIKAHHGETQAIQKLHALKGLADSGHKEAQGIISHMSIMHKLLNQKLAYHRDEVRDHAGAVHPFWWHRKKKHHHQRAQAVDHTAGWLYNKPYRDLVTAKTLDDSDPFVKMRFLYNEGMGR